MTCKLVVAVFSLLLTTVILSFFVIHFNRVDLFLYVFQRKNFRNCQKTGIGNEAEQTHGQETDSMWTATCGSNCLATLKLPRTEVQRFDRWKQHWVKLVACDTALLIWSEVNVCEVYFGSTCTINHKLFFKNEKKPAGVCTKSDGAILRVKVETTITTL